MNTRGHISVYRGSPLGALDNTLWREKTRLDQAGVVFQPGINEDLGATLVVGTQQLKDKHTAIGDVRGKSLMLAIEMVSDQVAKTPDNETTMEVFEVCRSQGIILSKSEPYQSCLRMVPPHCLTEEDVTMVLNGPDQAFEQATQRVRRQSPNRPVRMGLHVARAL